MKTLNIPIGFTFSLPCAASGFPLPTVYWRKKTTAGTNDTDTDTVKFSPFVSELAGKYTCIAKNAVGKATRSLELLAMVDENGKLSTFCTLTSINICLLLIMDFALGFQMRCLVGILGQTAQKIAKVEYRLDQDAFLQVHKKSQMIAYLLKNYLEILLVDRLKGHLKDYLRVHLKVHLVGLDCLTGHLKDLLMDL